MWKELLNLLLGSGLFITPKYFSKLGLGNTFIGFIIFSIYFGFLGWEFLKLKGNFLEYIKENVHLYIYQIILYCYMIITWAGTAAIISNASNYIPIKSSIIRKLLLLGLSFFNLSFIDIPANIIKIFLVFILPLFFLFHYSDGKTKHNQPD